MFNNIISYELYYTYGDEMIEKGESFTFTAIFWTAILLIIIGAITTILNIGTPTNFELSFEGFSVKTTQTGPIIMIIGILLNFITIKYLPENVTIKGDVEVSSFTEKLASKMPFLLLILLTISIILLIFTFIK